MRAATRDEALEALHTPYCWSMNTADTRWGSGVNAEAIQAWDGPFFDRFVQFRHILTTGLGVHGNEALRLNPPLEGQRVLDIGCGFGDTTQQIAALVGPTGEAVGVDAAENFTGLDFQAEEQVAEHALLSPTCRSTIWAAATTPPSRAWHAVLRQPRGRAPQRAQVAGAGRGAQHGRLAEARGQRVAVPPQQIVEGIVTRPDEYDEPTCGPGPFSMANADTVTDS